MGRVGVTLGGSDPDLVLRVPLGWMPALMVETVLLGGVGGTIIGHERASVLRAWLPSPDSGLLRRVWRMVR
ncbi:MAG: hypothetical protein M3P49_00940 [Actinomycetota bacterium]|nr:hypothetical protein [Actinomycetota bacterium]